MTDDMIPDADGRQCVIQQLERQLAERDARIKALENEIGELTRYRGVSPIVREALESTREERSRIVAKAIERHKHRAGEAK